LEADRYSDEYLTRYLLGELSEAERERVEEAYLSSRELQEQLLVVEDELVDDYAQDRLAATARAQFESHFLNSPARRERAGFARAWQAYVSQSTAKSEPQPGRLIQFTPKPASRPMRSLLIAATVLLALGSVWLLVETARLRRQVEQGRSERAALEQRAQDLQQQVDEARAHSEDLSKQLANTHDNQPPQPPNEIDTLPVAPAIVSFVLAAGLVRDTSSAKKLIIPHDTRQVRLQLRFRQAEYPGYRAVLRTAAGREVLNQQGLKAQTKGAGRVVVLQALGEGFASGDYILTLEGIKATGEAEVVAEYAFTVVKN